MTNTFIWLDEHVFQNFILVCEHCFQNSPAYYTVPRCEWCSDKGRHLIVIKSAHMLEENCWFPCTIQWACHESKRTQISLCSILSKLLCKLLVSFENNVHKLIWNSENMFIKPNEYICHFNYVISSVVDLTISNLLLGLKVIFNTFHMVIMMLWDCGFRLDPGIPPHYGYKWKVHFNWLNLPMLSTKLEDCGYKELCWNYMSFRLYIA